ncbi:MAG: hypothetical protein ACI8WB_003654 [Phenylobacterium sp.]|jgi:hypothetical protein
MSNNNSQTSIPLPGLDVVGRGIFLRPRQPYELKSLLFAQQGFVDFYARETGVTYSLPQGYAVNDSPPMPAGAALNRVAIEESTERLDKQSSLDADASCGVGAFSVDVSGSQAAKMQLDKDAYYATRTSFIPFWTLYLSEPPAIADDFFDMDIPVPFKHANRKQYDKFFKRFGSHFVKRAWIGGKATLTFSVLKSSEISEQQIRAGIKASYGSMGSGQVNSAMSENKEKLLSNSECEVSGLGGDSMTLAALNTLDEALYNQWVVSIKGNPQSIELEVAGIWTLIEDEEKSNALLAAYKQSAAFEQRSAIFSHEQTLYFLRDRNYSTYDVDSRESRKAQPICNKWPQLKEMGFHNIDACLSGNYIGADQQNQLSNKVFFFHGNYFVAMDTSDNSFGTPKPISEGWPGVTFGRIDAALHFEPESVYLFSGNQYVRFNIKENKVDEGYPALISERWVGVNFVQLDGAIYWGNGKVYFFREDRYVRYDVSNYNADPGYPKQVMGNYVEDWKIFV